MLDPDDKDQARALEAIARAHRRIATGELGADVGELEGRLVVLEGRVARLEGAQGAEQLETRAERKLAATVLVAIAGKLWKLLSWRLAAYAAAVGAAITAAITGGHC